MITIDKKITIQAPIEKVFNFWKEYQNFSKYIDDIESISKLSDTRSHWIINGPLHTHVEFDADTVECQQNKYIKWIAIHEVENDHLSEQAEEKLQEEMPVAGTGELFFNEIAPGSTEVHLKFHYTLPSKVKEVIASAMNVVGFPSSQFDKGLDDIKEHLETN